MNPFGKSAKDIQALCPACMSRHGERLRWIEVTTTGKKEPSSAGPIIIRSVSLTVPDRNVPARTEPTFRTVNTSSI